MVTFMVDEVSRARSGRALRAHCRGILGAMTRLVPALVLVLAACGGTTESQSGSIPSACADVTDVAVESESGGTFRFDVTVRSPDTGWEKYADAWEIRGADGSVLGARVLTHPHVDEQPFTRSLTGVAIPAGVTRVDVAAHDLVEGFCGTTLEVSLP